MQTFTVLAPKLLKAINPNISGIALFPFILVKEKHQLTDKVLINHEKIHFAQQLELLIIPFYLAYIFWYVFNLIRFRSHQKAYFCLPFEREAYANEYDSEYLANRKPFSFLKYVW